MKVNVKHKDRLFRRIFGSEEYKENTLALYNALNNSSYENAENLEIKTIEDVIYIGMKNDLSFLIADYLNLYEQQSSYNPNMPVRGFMYYGKMYSGYITENRCNLYGRTLIKLPTPRYVVFYNGVEKRPAIEKLKLSDAFLQRTETGEFEWTATMINLNYKDNESLLEKCKPLEDYTILIQKIQAYKRNMSVESAVNQAVEECIKEGRLEEFLIAHKGSVIEMCITEYNEDIFVNGIKEEGILEGQIRMIYKLVEDGTMNLETAAGKIGMSVEELQEKVKEYDI